MIDIHSELIENAKKTKNYEELSSLMKESGIEMPELTNKRLSDEELEVVSGGGSVTVQDGDTYYVYECNRYNTSFCMNDCPFNLLWHLKLAKPCPKFH